MQNECRDMFKTVDFVSEVCCIAKYYKILINSNFQLGMSILKFYKIVNFLNLL